MGVSVGMVVFESLYKLMELCVFDFDVVASGVNFIVGVHSILINKFQAEPQAIIITAANHTSTILFSHL